MTVQLSTRIGVVLVSLIVFLSAPNFVAAQDESPVDFERHVAPMLGRFGCNAAACHGAFGGKGGFQLSLFGHSAEMDFNAIYERLDLDDPEESLFLLKPTGTEAHKGGTKFNVDSDTYASIKSWIAAGANWTKNSGKVARLRVHPSHVTFDAVGDDAVSLRVVAEFADGSSSDVSKFALFSSRDEGLVVVDSEGVVAPVRQGATSVTVSYSNQFASVETIVPFAQTELGEFAVRNPIDKFINRKLEALRVVPSAESSDEEFLRRIMVDTIGRIPTPVEIVAFVEDASPGKREAKIDQLLKHTMHAALWANRMCEITKAELSVERFSDADINELEIKKSQWWHAWFRKRFLENRPYDEIAKGVLAATSRGQKDVADWMKFEAELIRTPMEQWKSNYADKDGLDLYWRRPDENGTYPVEDVAELTAAAFAGVRINCARCHKHPFDRWTQDDYASFTNIFSQVAFGSSSELNIAIFDELDRQRKAKKEGKPYTKLPQLQEVYNSAEWGRKVMGTSKESNVGPKPLGGNRLNSESDYRVQFAEWLTEKSNPFFARSFVNRVWDFYFGVGLVDPVDDFSVANTPSHPALLDWLAEQFIESDFNVRELEKLILMSAAYQRTSRPVKGFELVPRVFSRQTIRPMSAEVLLDSINLAMGSTDRFTALPEGTLAIELGGDRMDGQPGQFFQIFGKAPRESVCDCDRQTEPDIKQSIYLMVDEFMVDKIKNGSIRKLLDLDNREMLTQLYLRTLGRSPDSEEIEFGLNYFDSTQSREAAFDDFVWAILNSREFITNH